MHIVTSIACQIVLCGLCVHARTHARHERERARGSNASIWQRFEGSYRCKWSKCVPCNCTSRGSSLSRLVAVMSVADSICFSSFPFFFFLSPRDLISIPTQSFRILSSFLPHLPLLLFLFCQPISSGSSGNDANYGKEADVTAKHPVMGRNPLVPSLLFSSCLSPADSSHSRLISYISDTLKASIFAILLFLNLCPTAFLLLRTSHYFQKITHFGLSDVWAACFLHLLLGIENILHAGLHMEIDKSLCNDTVMRYQSTNLLQVRSAVILLFGGKRGRDGRDSAEVNCTLFISIIEMIFNRSAACKTLHFSCSGLTTNILLSFITEFICLFTAGHRNMLSIYCISLKKKKLQIIYFGIDRLNWGGEKQKPWNAVIHVSGSFNTCDQLTPPGCHQCQNPPFCSFSLLEHDCNL